MKKIFENKDLAINGGRPIRSALWHENITTGKEEIEAAVSVLQSGQLSLFEGSYKPDPPFDFWGGNQVKKLEQAWSEYYQVPFAVSMNSATSCLYAAVGALRIGYGDEVIVSPTTMSACAACVLLYGALPIFADVEDQTGCLDPDSIRKLITKRTKAIIVVHQFGFPAKMDEILKIARENNLYVIEDCAQAHGAKYGERSVGTLGDIGIFSLNVNKSIQTGEGGVCVCKDEEIRYRLALIRNHGEAVVGPAEYADIVNILGFNYRLTEIQAAIAIEQLKKLDTLNEQRIAFVKKFEECVNKFEFLEPHKPHEGTFPTYYVYPFKFNSKKVEISRSSFVEALNAEGACFYESYVKPLYLQPLYQRKLCFKHGYPFTAIENKEIITNYHEGACPMAEERFLNRLILNEHIRPPHSDQDIEDLVKILEKVSSAL